MKHDELIGYNTHIYRLMGNIAKLHFAKHLLWYLGEKVKIRV